VLADGWRTRESRAADTPGRAIVGTTAMGDLVAEKL